MRLRSGGKVILEMGGEAGDFFAGDGEGGGEGQDVRIGAIGQQEEAIGEGALEDGCGELGIWGAVLCGEFEAEHEAGAAEAGGGKGLEGVAEIAAGGTDLLGGFGFLVEIEGGEGHGAADGVAEEGGGVEGFAGGGGPGVHDIGTAYAGGDGEA